MGRRLRWLHGKGCFWKHPEEAGFLFTLDLALQQLGAVYISCTCEISSIRHLLSWQGKWKQKYHFKNGDTCYMPRNVLCFGFREWNAMSLGGGLAEPWCCLSWQQLSSVSAGVLPSFAVWEPFNWRCHEMNCCHSTFIKGELCFVLLGQLWLANCSPCGTQQSICTLLYMQRVTYCLCWMFLLLTCSASWNS